MSEEKRETKEALLGELESIKDLLSDDEWDDIPVLNDSISIPSPPMITDSNDDLVPDTERLELLSTNVEHQLELMAADAEEIPEFPAEAVIDTTTNNAPNQNTATKDEFTLSTAHIDTPPAADSYSGTDLADGDTTNADQTLSLNADQNTDIDAAVAKLDLDLSLDCDDEESLLLDQDFEEALEFTATNIAEQAIIDNSANGNDPERSFDHTIADKEFDSSNLDVDLDLSTHTADVNAEDSTATPPLASTVPAGPTDDTASATQDKQAAVGLDEEPSANWNREPSANWNKEPFADSNKEPFTDSNKKPSAGLNNELSADVNNERSTSLNHAPLVDSNNKPSTRLESEPSEEQAVNDLTASETTTPPNIAELVHDLEELDQSMMDVDIGTVDFALDHETDTETVNATTATQTEPQSGENATPEIIENSEFAKTLPLKVEEYQHDAFAHLPVDETPLSPFGPAGISAITSLSQNYPQDHGDGQSAVDIKQTGSNLPAGVLPGQQSLFSGDTKSLKSDQSSGYSRGERPTKASGENPFLPKHIRDRLHTNKALVDIIKESPLPPPTAARPLSHQIHESVKQQLPPELSTERLHDMVEEVMALYMPKIEAELRERLLNEVKLIEPPAPVSETLESQPNQSSEHKTTPDNDPEAT